jgi:hypothetical protein
MKVVVGSDTLPIEDPRVALTTEGMTNSRRESIMNLSTRNRENYHAYLKSMEWRVKKNQWINSGRPLMCWACEKPMPKNRSGFNFHHRSYANLGNENFDDLVLLCMADHKALSKEWDELKVIRGHCLYNQTHIYVISKRINCGLSTNKNNSIMKYLGEYHE